MKILQYRWFGPSHDYTNMELVEGNTAIDITASNKDALRGKQLLKIGIQAFPGTKVILTGNYKASIQELESITEITEITEPCLVIGNSGFYQAEYENFQLETLAIEIIPELNYSQYGVIIDLMIDDSGKENDDSDFWTEF